jgi:hypothetical protein
VDFFGIARGSRPQFADPVTALIGQPTGGIATKARRRVEPVSTNDGTDFVHRGLRDGEGEPIEGGGKDVVAHEQSFHASAIQAPVLPNGGVSAERVGGWRRRSRAAWSYDRWHPFGYPLHSFQVEAQHFADAIGGDLASPVGSRIDCTLTPNSWAISLTDNNVRFRPVLSFVYASHGAEHIVLHG